MNELIAVAAIIAATWLVTMYMWLSGSMKAAKAWKARYMTVQRELNRLQGKATRQKNEEADIEDIMELLGSLGIENEELAEAIAEMGIPKTMIEFAMKNPGLVMALIQKFMGPQGQATENIIKEDEVI